MVPVSGGAGRGPQGQPEFDFQALRLEQEVEAESRRDEEARRARVVLADRDAVAGGDTTVLFALDSHWVGAVSAALPDWLRLQVNRQAMHEMLLVKAKACKWYSTPPRKYWNDAFDRMASVWQRPLTEQVGLSLTDWLRSEAQTVAAALLEQPAPTSTDALNWLPSIFHAVRCWPQAMPFDVEGGAAAAEAEAKSDAPPPDAAPAGALHPTSTPMEEGGHGEAAASEASAPLMVETPR
eukprot:3454237-Pyramimonas_sp.AAC.1